MPTLKSSPPHFTKESLRFLNQAGRQKNIKWLDQNLDEYRRVLQEPMRALMLTVAQKLQSQAPGYRFPMRNFARLKRGANREKGETPFRDWFHTSASRHSESRYDSFPNLYFHFSDTDFYSAGGLYVPGADQTRHIRKWISQDPSALEDLLEDKKFKSRFKNGLGTERMLKTKPRDYPVDHPKFEWLRLSAWYVWRQIPTKAVLSKDFADFLIEDWTQVLRLNRILDQYTTSWPKMNTIESLPAAKPRQLDW